MSRRLSKYLRNRGSYRQEVDCFGKTWSSRFGISHPISIISNSSGLADQKVFRTFVQISQERRQVQTRGRLFWKNLYKPVRNQSSDLDYLKRFGLGGPESVRDVCPNISGTEAATDKRSTVLERPCQAGSESVIRSRLSQTVRILRTKNRIASHLPEGCELWPQVLASRRLQIRKKVLLLQSFSIL